MPEFLRDLLSSDGTTLPSSPLFANLLSHKSDSWEWVDNLTHISGRHLIRVGGGVLFRPTSGSLGVGWRELELVGGSVRLPSEPAGRVGAGSLDPATDRRLCVGRRTLAQLSRGAG